ncbi:ABC transporter ATP-binding protein [Fusobacterium sp.]|uniref:ABC transporter ATP-binding protein n=1 Tax=Fusobacterium sp. TaxID=68766 RepID=UPI0025C2C028|nr:ABC transporter ATP-binding protein [Fusobacterium sp.]
MDSIITIEKLSYSIDNKKILKDISLKVKKRQIVGIIGANGCGKSTLLKNIYKYLSRDSGKIEIDSILIDNYKVEELAKKITVLLQNQNINFDFTVEELVEMGRFIHKKSIFDSLKTDNIVNMSLKAVGMYEFKDRSFLELSGGERQRVLVAKCLSQESEIIILDEPTNHLDIKYKIQIMNIIKQLNKTILTVIHDINIASNYCDYIYALKNGSIICCGTPREVLTKENIKNIFDVECEVIPHPKTKLPLIIF